MTFGEHARQARESRGMTQKDLAAAAGYSPQFIGDVELGRRPVPDNVVRAVARALGVPRDLAYVWAGKLPPDLRRFDGTEAAALASVLAVFRATLRGR